MAQKKAALERAAASEGGAAKRNLHSNYKPENGPTSSRNSWTRALGPMLSLSVQRGDWRVLAALGALWRRHIGGAP